MFEVADFKPNISIVADYSSNGSPHFFCPEIKGKSKKKVSFLQISAMKETFATNIVVILHQNDEDHYNRFAQHLQRLKVSVWDNVTMLAGNEIDATIQQKLATATLILPLLSIDSLNKYENALRSYVKSPTQLVPILLRSCWLERSFFKKRPILPINLTPVNLHPDEDAVWTDIVIRLEKLLQGEAWRDTSPTSKSPNEGLPHAFTLLPSSPKVLLGREQDLKKLQTHLEAQNALLLVSGMGGIGKTSLALTYMNTHRDQYDHIAWVRYTESLALSFQNSLQVYHPNWQIREKESHEAYLKRILYNMQNMKGKCLLLVDGWDNVDEIHETLTAISLPNWTILVTTRSQSDTLPSYALEPLAQHTAKALYEQYCPKATGDPDLLSLLEHINYHTLMIELLAKTMQQASNIHTIAHLLTLLDKHEMKAADLQQRIRILHSRKEVQLFQHLLATFAIAEFPSQKREAKLQKGKKPKKNELHLLKQKMLLRYFSVLPSLPIKIEELLAWIKIEAADRSQWENALYALVAKGWIEKTEENAYFGHPIVREALRTLVEPNAENCAILINTFSWLLKPKKAESRLKKAFLIPYAEAILQYITSQDQQIATLANDLALVYQALGSFSKTLITHLKAVAIYEAILDPKHPALAISYNNLSLIYKDLGKLPKALEFQVKTVKIFEAILDPKHPALATSYNNLSTIYKDLGKLPKALKFQLKASDIREAILDSKHPDLATSYNNLSAIYKAVGKLPKALEFQVKATNIREAILDSKHPALAQSYSNLSLIYKAVGKLPKALEFQVKATDISEAILDSKHPDLATSYNNLSAIYKAVGKLPKALEFQVKATNIREATLDSKHPDLATSYNNLSVIYQAVGKLPKALEFQVKAIAIREAILDPKHPDLAQSYNNLSTIYHALGKLPKALEFQVKAIDIKEAILDPKHPSLAISYINITRLYFHKKELSTAKDYIDKAVAILQHNFPNGHPILDDALAGQKYIYQHLKQ